MAVDAPREIWEVETPPAATKEAHAFRSPVTTLLETLYEAHSDLVAGEVATYIPELASADPDSFGIALATTGGSLYEVGDSRSPFTLQSISKPLTYGLALERLGQQKVHERIGVEPSGDAFNSIDLAPDTGTPANAMINAGAITAAALLANDLGSPFPDVLDLYGRYAGRTLSMDEAVYASERATGHRNRAIAHLLRTFDVVEGDPEEGLDLYFRQCAVTVDCRDLALIGATLANGGIHPRTGVPAVGANIVRDVLSVMTSCGMYDGAGRWLKRIGLPAKSGVSGGILAVLPGRLAVAVYSPRLDLQGNSTRGVAVCRDLSARLNLHLVRPGERVASPIRSSRTLADSASKRARTAAERRILDETGTEALVFELQGELGFGAVEIVSQRLQAMSPLPQAVIVDVRRITAGESGGVGLLEELHATLADEGIAFAVAGTPAPDVVGLLGSIERFPELDRALEWCEDELLRRAGMNGGLARVNPAEHELLVGMPRHSLVRLRMLMRPQRHGAGETVVAKGAPADELFLVLAGKLTVTDAGGDGTRLATISAGMTFGELGFALGSARTADVVADTDVEMLVLDRATLALLRAEDTLLYATLLERLLASLARTTVRLDLEARAVMR